MTEANYLTRELLMNRLLALPATIEAAEADLHELDAARRSLVFAIEGKEASLLAAGQIEGKNAECRAAALRELTCPERQSLLVLEGRLACAKRIVRYRENEFAAARAIARLLSGAETAL